jgi:GNAT superfamily N-acetyltransferase
MKSCTVREAVMTDAPAIACLLEQLGYPALPDEMKGRLQALITHRDYMVFVAETSGHVVGLVGAHIACSLEFTGRYGRLTDLVVHEKWQGRGIGKCLMAGIEEWLREQSAVLAVVAGGMQRTRAHRFYRSLGYGETGIQFVKQLTQESRT